MKKKNNKPAPLTQWGICQVCQGEVFRDIYPRASSGSWWHEFPGQDFKHKPVPTGWRGLWVELVAWWRGDIGWFSDR